jgi:rubredoxin
MSGERMECPTCGEEYKGLQGVQRHTSGDNDCVPLQIYYLRRDGPIPASKTDEYPCELQRNSNVARGRIRVFKLSARSSGGAESMGGTQTRVYHLEEHDTSAVLRAYFDANPQVVENLSVQGALHRVSSASDILPEAAREILTDYYSEDEWAEAFGRGNTRPFHTRGPKPKHVGEEHLSGDEPGGYECDVCGDVLDTERGMKIHRTRVHGDEVASERATETYEIRLKATRPEIVDLVQAADADIAEQVIEQVAEADN